MEERSCRCVYGGQSTKDCGREILFVHYRRAVGSKKRKYREGGRKGLGVGGCLAGKV
jgi:hypothetical protein